LIVADTNLVAYLLIEGEKTAAARAVWAKDSRWMLPTLWRSEFLNVLTTAVRARVLTIAQAHDTWHIAHAMFDQSEVEPSGDDVLDAAAERNLSAYDAQFVVAAVDLDVPLVTADRRLLEACPDLAIALDRFTA
jgi:predicted nucleic acid-binding protein